MHRLIGKSEQPKNWRQERACRDAQVDLKTDDVRPILRVDILVQHSFKMAPRVGLIAPIVVRDSEHTLAHQPMIGIGSVHGQSTETLSLGQGGTTPSADTI